MVKVADFLSGHLKRSATCEERRETRKRAGATRRESSSCNPSEGHGSGAEREWWGRGVLVSGRLSVFFPLFCLEADAARAPEVRSADFRQERAPRGAEMECAVGVGLYKEKETRTTETVRKKMPHECIANLAGEH